MNNILLIETSDDGHHKVYSNTLKENLDNISFKIKPIKNKSNKFLDFINRYIYLRSLLKYDYTVIHHLYGDILYIFPLFKKKKNFIITLHHIPENKIKMKLLKLFSKKISKIVVHSEYSKIQLIKNGIKNVEHIEYPSFYNYDNIQKKSINNKKVLSLLGGTRKDKGLDIFLESLSFLEDRIKEKIFINIKGKEGFFKFEDIKKILKAVNVEHEIDLRFISDEEFQTNIEISDAIILPYRKIFTGNSGPMTEGVVREKCIIAPDYGNLGYLTKKYNLGYTFKSEDPKSLADSIEKFIDKGWFPNQESKKYKDKLNVKYFIESHKKLYTKLFKELEEE